MKTCRSHASLGCAACLACCCSSAAALRDTCMHLNATCKRSCHTLCAQFAAFISHQPRCPCCCTTVQQTDHTFDHVHSWHLQACGDIDNEQVASETRLAFVRHQVQGCLPAAKAPEAAQEVFAAHGGNILPVSVSLKSGLFPLCTQTHKSGP